MGKFTAAQFTATKWDTSEDKARFANKFIAFVNSGYKLSLFPKTFYRRLSMTFGHIAHYNQGGFYETFFTSLRGRVDFARITLNGGGYGDPTYTYSDVEIALRQWALEMGMLEKAQSDLNRGIEISERAELNRLSEKYSRIP